MIRRRDAKQTREGGTGNSTNLLEGSFPFEKPSEPSHQIGPKGPAVWLLGIGIAEVRANFLESFFRLIVALKTLRFFQGRVKGVERKFVVPKRTNALHSLHHGLVAERGEMVGINFF